MKLSLYDPARKTEEIDPDDIASLYRPAYWDSQGIHRPHTVVYFHNGGPICVAESPDEIMALAGRDYEELT